MSGVALEAVGLHKRFGKISAVNGGDRAQKTRDHHKSQPEDPPHRQSCLARNNRPLNTPGASTLIVFYTPKGGRGIYPERRFKRTMTPAYRIGLTSGTPRIIWPRFS